MKKTGIFVILTIFAVCNSAFATQTVPLNTGYNHALTVDAPYAPLPNQDNYWIRIGSGFPALSPSVAPAFAISPAFGWLPPFPNSTWINATNSSISIPGVNPNNPGYQVYRKCFCLRPGFNQARMQFRVRADDSVTIFFNNYGNQVLQGNLSNWGGGNPYSVNVDSGFKVGRNCLFVLVGDNLGGNAGFNLAGNVQANGLLPTPSFGIQGQNNQGTFEPCGCEQGPAGAQLQKKMVDDDEQAVREIVKFAEMKRIENIRIRRDQKN